MPLHATAVSLRPKESPLQNTLHLAWAMNFAAAASLGGEPLAPFVNNAAGRVPAVHPLFLASCLEVVGAWACVYLAGMSKAEVVRHTFAHHTFDTVHLRELRAGESLTSTVELDSVSWRPSGGRFTARFEHRDAQGRACCESWWGGVLLGLPESAVRGEARSASRG